MQHLKTRQQLLEVNSNCGHKSGRRLREKTQRATAIAALNE